MGRGLADEQNCPYFGLFQAISGYFRLNLRGGTSGRATWGWRDGGMGPSEFGVRSARNTQKR